MAEKKPAPMMPPAKPASDEYTPSPEKQRQMKEIADQERMRRAGDTAPTTKTEMGKRYAKGGYVSAADGCVQRGKTKGRMV